MTLSHNDAGWKNPVRDRKKRQVQEQNRKSQRGLPFQNPDRENDRRQHEQHAQPRHPILSACKWNRIEVVIARDIDRGQQELEVLQEGVAGCQLALGKRPLTLEVLCRSRHSERAENPQPQTEISDRGSRYCCKSL